MNAPHWRPAYLGIGSNLESPEGQVRNAIRAIGDMEDTVLVATSGLFRSSPMGPADQPDFVNAVVGILTQLSAARLFEAMQAVEQSQGRTRDGERWGPRILDLDLLAYSGQSIKTDELEVPHPGIALRNFVLLPWQEIAPCYRLPGGADIAGLASAVSHTDPQIERIG